MIDRPSLEIEFGDVQLRKVHLRIFRSTFVYELQSHTPNDYIEHFNVARDRVHCMDIAHHN